MTLLNPDKNPLRIIAIGASAGGLEAIQDFLSHLPELDDTSIIIAQHLSPTHKSMLVQLLSRETKFRVSEAVHGQALESGTVYITPPDKDVLVQGDQVLLRKPPSSVGPKPSVDALFRSLADQKNRLIIGIVLSGTGSDGSHGVVALKNSSGIILVQEPDTAKYDGMPSSAINTGLVDLVLPPEKMGEEIDYIFNNSGQTRKGLRAKDKELGNQLGEEKEDTLNRVFDLLGKRSGTDFSNYKSATITRRLEKRLNHLGIDTLEDYLSFIEKEPREIDEMFKTILIGVTQFFRDEEAFRNLEESLKQVVNNKSGGESIRVWVAGCSTGEEPYTIAIILHRLLRNKNVQVNVQVFATDIDQKAIAFARKGIYPASSMEHLPKEVQDSYFIKRGKDYELLKVIRGMVLFSKHDIIKNPPFLKLDLISCRNLLIYFNSTLQQQIMPIFHYALNIGGFLFLGKSETIGAFTDLFSTVDGKNKLFQRKRGGNLHAIKFSALKPQSYRAGTSGLPKENPERGGLTIPEMVKETFYNTFEFPYVVVDDEYNIQEVNGDVRLFLSLVPGTIQVNILKMVNPELQIELRSILTRVIRERIIIKSNIKKFDLFGSIHYVRITAKPLLYANAVRELFLVIFEKMELEEFLDKSTAQDEDSLINAKIQELEHELAATKEHLQTYIEEIETTNEELQSLNEEMQSTNEELQSSNEELETSNEELQSTNEEVQIAYAELKATHEELEKKDREIEDKQANLQALLNNDQQAFILLDTNYKILLLNNQGIELLESLKDLEVKTGSTIIDYLPPGQVDGFVQDFTSSIRGESITTEKILKDKKGNARYYTVNFTPIRILDEKVERISLAIMDITDLKEAIREVSFKDRMISSVFNAMSTGICITDSEGKYLDVNQSYCDIYGYTKEDFLGNNFTMVVPEDSRKELQDLHDKFIETGKEIDLEFDVQKKDGTRITVSAKADLLIQGDGSRYKVTSVIDITGHKLTEGQLKHTADNIPGAIFRYKISPGGKEEIQNLTKGASLLWRTSPEEVMADATRAWELCHPDDVISIRDELNQSGETMETFSKEYRVVHKDGSLAWHKGIGVPKKESDGGVIWDFIIFDITEEKNHKLGILEQNNNLREIAWIQSHEVRAPLSQILGLAQLAEEGLVKPDEWEDFLSKIKKAAGELDKTLRNVVSRLESMETGELQEEDE